LGNKCFMNSILQCLFHTLSLSDYIISSEYQKDLSNENKKKNEHYVLLSYITLINNIWDSNQVIKPKSFVENLSKFHSKYFSMTQQDSHECLLYILEILHNALSYSIEIEIKGQENSNADILMKNSLKSWQNFYEDSYSFIIETFNGSNITNITCIGCKNIETIFEPYNTISVDIGSSNLITCLDDYFRDEKVNSFNCSNCKVETNECNKETKLWTVPNYLIIHLKRFKQTLNGIEKNNNLVEFPLKDLDITQFISGNKDDKNNYIYDLYAINQHSGSIEGGHYWASCKNLDNEWYNFNDNSISKYNKVNTNQLINNDAYILFYHRKFVKNPIMI
jgi:ubiquitin C-terminal hydrolase